MKATRKISALIVALVMVLALAVTANAANTGSITIQNAAVGETYDLYKIASATTTNGGIDYSYSSIPAALQSYFTAGTTTVGGVTYNTLTLTGGMTDAFKAAVKTWAEAQANPDQTATAAGNTVQFSNIPAGYYAIISSQGNVIMIDSATNPVSTVYEKNETTLSVPSKTHDDTADANVQIGDTVEYTVTFTTTNYKGTGAQAQQITKYTLKDDAAGGELANLTITSVKVGNTELLAANTTATFPYDIAWVNATTGASLYPNGARVTVKYTALVNSTATGAIKNTFTVEEYAGNTKVEEKQDDDTVETAKLNILKYDGADNTKAPLAGATFELKNGNTTISLIATANGYRVALPGETGAVTSFTTAGSVIVIDGLDKDVAYTLTETAAPDGYNKLSAPVSVVTGSTTAVGANGNLEIANHKGAELPATGGIGTTIFTVVGATLMVGAAVLYVTKKRSVID